MSSTNSSTAINVSLVSNELSSIMSKVTVCVVTMPENSIGVVSFMKSEAEMKNC